MMDYRAISLGMDYCCVSWFRCTKCEKVFSSELVGYQKQNENGTQKYCPHCKTELKGLDGVGAIGRAIV